jgi:exosortase A
VSAVPLDLPGKRPWRVALPAVLALVAAILLLYRDTALAMVEIWSRSDTFAHAFLVPPISLWLIWRQRERLALLTPRPQLWLLLPLLAAAGVWLLAELAIVNAAAQFALVGMVVLAVPTVLGWAVARFVMFSLLFLLFAVPFGDFMLPWMMEWTADFTVAALQFSGVPVYREGLQFVIPSGNWSVVEACSGVRYLIASFMVGTLFAYMNYRSTLRRVIFIAVSIAVPIVANWLRAYMIVMLGHLSGNTIAVGVDHLIYGWVFFGVVIGVMFLIGARWSEPDPMAAESPEQRRSEQADDMPGGVLLSATLCTLVIVLPLLAASMIQRAEAAADTPRLELPAALAGGWTRLTATPAGSSALWEPRLEAPAVLASGTYARDGQAVGVHVAYYRAQSIGSKLVSSQNVFVASNDKRWNKVSGRAVNVPTGAGAIPFRTADLLGRPSGATETGSQLAVWRVYWVDGRWIASDAAAKLHNAMARLRGRGDDGAAIFFFVETSAATASPDTLASFTIDNIDSFDALLWLARNAR